MIPPRWYCVSRDGMATLCNDEEDAISTAKHSTARYPGQAPYHAVLLGDVADERERCANVCEDKAAALSPAVDERALTWAAAAIYCASAIRELR